MAYPIRRDLTCWECGRETAVGICAGPHKGKQRDIYLRGRATGNVYQVHADGSSTLGGWPLPNVDTIERTARRNPSA